MLWFAPKVIWTELSLKQGNISKLDKTLNHWV